MGKQEPRFDVRRGSGRLPRGMRVLFPVGAGGGLAHLLNSERVRVYGASMEPTLSPGQYLLVSKLAYRAEQPERGDIVVLRDPWGDNRDYVKRIIGLPTEHVTMEDGRVFADGTPLDEPYLKVRSAFPAYGDWELEADQYVVMGDNRRDSRDSRTLGPVARLKIVGLAWLCYWPWSRWGAVR